MPLTKIDDRGLTTPVDLLDNEKIRFGTGNDLQIYHIADTTNVISGAGPLTIQSNDTTSGVSIQTFTDGETMAKFIKNGAVELNYDNTKRLETKSDGARFTGHLYANDNEKIRLGTGHDLEIYHSGTASFISNITACTLLLQNEGNIQFEAKSGEDSCKMIPHGAVELYYDNSKKFETTSSGIAVTGNVEPTGHLKLGDDRFVYFGAGGSTDLYIGHQPSNSRHLFRSGDGATKMVFQGGSETMMVLHPQAQVELYHDNSKKFETTSYGARVYGNLENHDNNFVAKDNCKFIAGNSEDLQIYHDGGNSYIDENGTGNLRIRNVNGNGIELISGTGELNLKCNYNGSVDLYHDNSKKLETTSYGARTTGYHTQSTAIGFQGDNADWTSSTPHMHNMSLKWNSGHFVNSTGVFTCPVAGKYLCSATVQAHRANNPSGSNGQYYNVLWQKNSSNYHVEMVGTLATDASSLNTSDVNGKHEQVTAVVIMDCAANDTIRAHSNHGYRHDSQNICSVYLLG